MNGSRETRGLSYVHRGYPPRVVTIDAPSTPGPDRTLARNGSDEVTVTTQWGHKALARLSVASEKVEP
ncbi:hypothetical protein GCM10010121_036620 [Streptomyces brasiliensis]|uniref:Uncharacterized protein n=1 Tax=Streptomyces brasiliensis TaxID=1954 RepID=A0A917KPX5_9ACTN|nr:hypothetical protein GCM10010121_036620 [Streptomyces brasiliensis]